MDKMKYIGFLSLSFLLALGTSNCGHVAENSTDTDATDSQPTTPVPPKGFIRFDSLLNNEEAKKIIGEACHLTEKRVDTFGRIWMQNYTYTANTKDPASGKTGNLYVVFEQYPDKESAHKIYADIKKSNEDHGIKTLDSLGDEAYFHTDNTNFYFIMVRKGKNMFRLKVNKTTAKTSRKVFMDISSALTQKI